MSPRFFNRLKAKFDGKDLGKIMDDTNKNVRSLNPLSQINGYLFEMLNHVKNTSDRILESVAKRLFDCAVKGKMIFLVGNGGSAATAEHFCCDLSKGCNSDDRSVKVRSISLTSNTSLSLAVCNDVAFESLFVEQLKIFSKAEDILIAISASGNSKNVVNAAEYAKQNGMFLIVFTGFDGGKLSRLSNIEINVPSQNYGQIEDMHLIYAHIISQTLRHMLKTNSKCQ